jgi:hypothetical protein
LLKVEREVGRRKDEMKRRGCEVGVSGKLEIWWPPALSFKQSQAERQNCVLKLRGGIWPSENAQLALIFGVSALTVKAHFVSF